MYSFSAHVFLPLGRSLSTHQNISRAASPLSRPAHGLALLVRSRTMHADTPVFLSQRDPRWVSFDNGPGRWDRSLGPTGYSTTANGGYLPPPPRNPRLAALLAASNTFGMTSDELLDRDYQPREIRHFSCWRLRWCAFCLVVANAMQASIVGVQLQAFFAVAPGASREPGTGANLVGSMLLLATMLIALWSLLSQLLLWSDAAVMKVPEGVHVSDHRHRRRLGDSSPTRREDDNDGIL